MRPRRRLTELAAPSDDTKALASSPVELMLEKRVATTIQGPAPSRLSSASARSDVPLQGSEIVRLCRSEPLTRPAIGQWAGLAPTPHGLAHGAPRAVQPHRRIVGGHVQPRRHILQGRQTAAQIAQVSRSIRLHP